MTDKELAEKTAKYLGWVKDGNVWNKWESSTYSPVKWLEPLEGKGGIEAVVFSWPVSGMMIEKMDGYSWALQATNNCFSFREWFGDCWDRETNIHSINKTCNYHKSIALAFCEAMEMIYEI